MTLAPKTPHRKWYFFYSNERSSLEKTAQEIEISTGSACDGQNTEISHVLKAIQLDEAYARGTVRISLGDYNNEDDVIAIVEALRDIIG